MAKPYDPMACYEPIARSLAKGRAGAWSEMYYTKPEQWATMETALREAHPYVFDFAGEDVENPRAVAQFTMDALMLGRWHTPFDVTLLQWPQRASAARPEVLWQYDACLIITAVRKFRYTKWAQPLGLARVLSSASPAPPFLPGLPSPQPRLLDVREGGRAKEFCAAVAFGFATRANLEKMRDFLSVERFEELYRGRESETAMLQDASFFKSFPSAGERVNLSLNMSQQADQFARHMQALRIFRRDSDAARARKDSAIRSMNVLYYMGVLGSRGPRERKVQVDPIIAKRRERLGRPPLVSYSVISLPLTPKAQVSSGRTVGARGPVRQHWRQGHWRRRPGEPPETPPSIPVSPCLVGSSELGRVIASYYVGDGDED
jgi:hypothetical protein